MNTLLVFTKAYRHCLLQYSANTLYTSANGLQLHDRASKGTCPLPTKQLQLASNNLDIGGSFQPLS